MKLKNIFNTLSLAAVALVATACQDTDAQVNIAEVGAPELVSVTPEATAPVLFGEQTFTVTFDKNVGFATKNTSLITLNGKPVKSAKVNGVSKALTIVADVDFSKTQVLKIPAGLVVGPQQKPYNQEITQQWTISDLSTDNAAYAMTQKLGWGWNLGNHFDTSDMTWGYWDGVATLTAAPFATLAAAGAKTVRIPTTWTVHMDDTNTIDAAYLDEVAAVVDLAIAQNLNVVLNTHHDSFETDLGKAAGDENIAKADSTLIVDLWTQVATRFANYGDQLIFETFNEVHAGDDWSTGSEAQFDLLNKWNQYAVDAIRATGGNNATRWIAVSGYASNIDLTIAHLVVPADEHIIVAVHSYDPYAFCTEPLNKAGDATVNSWGHNADPSKSVSGANEDYVIRQLYKLRTAYIEKGIPCYLGEYGCVYHPTDNANAFRKYYFEFFCRAAYLAGIPMFIWDNNVSGVVRRDAEEKLVETFGYIDHANGSWMNDSEETVPMMINACTNTDESYWFDTIWSKAPVAE